MTDEGDYMSNPPLEDLGVPVFDLAELREREGGVLGRGAFGVVRSIEGYPGLAAKEVRLDGLGASALRSLRFELTTLTTFTHPGILRYHQIIEDEDGDLIYIVMDRHDTSLETLIMRHRRKKEPIPAETTVALVGQIAGALAYLHGFCGTDVDGRLYQGVIHRDLKPANILVSEDGNRLVLADFGLCRSAMTSGTTRAGSPAYMAPETLLEGRATPISDIWSLGVIIYELATLKRPNFLEGKEPKDVFIDGWKPDLSDVKNDFIRAIIERIFVMDPEKRLTARDMHEMLSPCDVSADELGAQYMVLQHKCSSLETALNDASARIAILEGDTKTKSGKIVALEEGLEAKADEISTLEEALAIKASELDSLRSIVVTQEANVDAVKQDLEMKSNKVDVLEHTLIAKSAKIDTINGELQNNSSKINSLESVIAVQAAEIDVLKNSLVTKSEKIDTLEAQCKEHSTAMKTLESRIALLIAKSNLQSELLLLPRLMRAAHTNSIETVQMLVEGGDGVGKRDEQGRTALMHAAQQGHVEPVRLLVSNERSLQDRNGWTALMHAVHNNHPGVVEILAAHECGNRDINGRTALMIAAERGHTEIVAVLAQHEKGLTDSSGSTALMLAADNARTEAVRQLVEHEKGMKDCQNHNALYHALKTGLTAAAEIIIPHEDPTDENGITALMRATARGDVEMVELLAPLQKGMKGKDGNLAFVHALTNKFTNTAMLLLENEAPSWTPLMCAAFTGDVKTAKRHLSDKDKKNSDGDTALMIAAKAGHKKIVELLDPTDENGVTALMRAAEEGDTEIVKLLLPLQKGMKAEYLEIDEWEMYEGTALMIAAAYGHTEVVKLLVEKEGGLHDDVEQTALMWAAQGGHAEAVKLLIEYESGLEDNIGKTALMLAAEHGHVECVKLLVEYESGMVDEEKHWTALMFAAAYGHTECVKLLAEQEADMQDRDRWTALDLAKREGYNDIVSLLQ